MVENIRENFGQWAGGGFFIGNIAMTFKGVVEKVINEVPVSWQDVYANPMASAIGGAFIVSSSMLALKGGTSKGLRNSQIAATVGYILLGVDAVMHENMGSTLGAGLGVISCGYAIYSSLKQERDAKKPVEEATKTGSFRENMAKISRKYPYLPTGVIDVCTHTTLMLGAIAAHDPALALVAGIWDASAGLFALALPKPSGMPKPV